MSVFTSIAVVTSQTNRLTAISANRFFGCSYRCTCALIDWRSLHLVNPVRFLCGQPDDWLTVGLHHYNHCLRSFLFNSACARALPGHIMAARDPKIDVAAVGISGNNFWRMTCSRAWSSVECCNIVSACSRSAPSSWSWKKYLLSRR